jgi:hypothetical protein
MDKIIKTKESHKALQKNKFWKNAIQGNLILNKTNK